LRPPVPSPSPYATLFRSRHAFLIALLASSSTQRLRQLLDSRAHAGNQTHDLAQLAQRVLQLRGFDARKRRILRLLDTRIARVRRDLKSTRLNSSHVKISY